MKKIALLLVLFAAFFASAWASAPSNLQVRNVSISPSLVTTGGTTIEITAEFSFNHIQWGPEVYWIAYLSKDPASFNGAGSQVIDMRGGREPLEFSPNAAGVGLGVGSNAATSFNITRTVSFVVPNPLPQNWANSDEPWYVIVRIGGGPWGVGVNSNTWSINATNLASQSPKIDVRTNISFVENIARSSSRASLPAVLRIVDQNKLTISATPSGGTFHSQTLFVELTAGGAPETAPTIWFTIDGSDPRTSPSRVQYNSQSGITLDFAVSEKITLKAFAESHDDDYDDSAVGEWEFVHEKPKLDIQARLQGSTSLLPEGVHLFNGREINVVFEATNQYNVGDFKIIYTVNGGDPITVNSPAEVFFGINVFVNNGNRIEVTAHAIDNFGNHLPSEPKIWIFERDLPRVFIDAENYDISPAGLQRDGDGNIIFDTHIFGSNDPLESQMRIPANGNMRLVVRNAATRQIIPGVSIHISVGGVPSCQTEQQPAGGILVNRSMTVTATICSDDYTIEENLTLSFRQQLPIVITPISPISPSAPNALVNGRGTSVIAIADFSTYIDGSDRPDLDASGRIFDALGNLIAQFSGIGGSGNLSAELKDLQIAVRREDGTIVDNPPTTQVFVYWNGTNQQGRTVAEGMYRFVLTVTGTNGNTVNRTFNVGVSSRVR